ncbi:PEP-CTERM sorting domain-containing protein [Verrucomicrobiota bacterium sgz303538]
MWFPRSWSARHVILVSSVATLIGSRAIGQTLPFSDGLVYHLDASTGVTTSGSAVSGWADQSGNGLNFEQSLVDKQPTLVLDAIGGRPAIRFDGNLTGNANGDAPAADELILSIATTVRTFVAVNRLAAGNVSLAGFWGANDADTGIRRSNSSTWQGSLEIPGNTNDFANGGTTLVNGIETGLMSENVPHVLFASRGSDTTFNATSIGDYFKVGTNTPRPYKGDVSEVLVFNRTLTSSEQAQLNVHLAAKYQVPISGGLVLSVGGVNQIGTQVITGTQARYVRIHTEGTSSGGTDANANSIHVGELEVFSTETGGSTLDYGGNLALGLRGSTFTTVLGGGGHGADANVINGTLDTGANAWTRVGTNPQGGPVEGLLDLGTDRLVGSVRVWQRPDCCGERLQNFSVTVEDASHNVLQTFDYPGRVPNASYAEFDLDDLSNAFTVGQHDILALEVSAVDGLGDMLSIGENGLGTLTLSPGASLAILNLGGTFTPGQSFNILDFGTISGTFETISLPGGTSLWDTSKLYTNGVISVIPEPTSVALILIGTLVLSRLRRRA